MEWGQKIKNMLIFFRIFFEKIAYECKCTISMFWLSKVLILSYLQTELSEIYIVLSFSGNILVLEANLLNYYRQTARLEEVHLLLIVG